MFEAKLPDVALANAFDRPAGVQQSLRAMAWSDLVARFDAARELRTELGAGEAASGASFDPDSARHIAEIGESKQDINFDVLANGKAANGMGRTDNDDATSADLRK